MNIERRTQNVESSFAKAPADKRRTASHPCQLHTGAGESRATRHAFSLTEVLIAVGILAVGMLFIAGVFPVSIHFTMVATERTIAATVADEAFAKIKLYGILLFIDPNWNIAGQCQYPFEFVASTQPPADYFAYPSMPSTEPYSKKYWWSAICRKADTNPLSQDVQVTVFVSRKVGATTTYNNPIDTLRPVAKDVNVTGTPGNYELTINDSKNLINDGYTIVDDASGQIYRVLERLTPPLDNRIRLDKPWSWNGASHVWVVSPPVNGGRYPCIAVYQKVMRF